MSAGAIPRRARRFLLASACFLVAWQAGALAGISHRAAVVLGLLGFVLHAVFGKAYSLVLAYFDRELAIERAPTVQFPLTVVGTLCLALGAAHPQGDTVRRPTPGVGGPVRPRRRPIATGSSGGDPPRTPPRVPPRRAWYVRPSSADRGLDAPGASSRSDSGRPPTRLLPAGVCCVLGALLERDRTVRRLHPTPLSFRPCSSLPRAALRLAAGRPGVAPIDAPEPPSSRHERRAIGIRRGSNGRCIGSKTSVAAPWAANSLFSRSVRPPAVSRH